MPVYCYSERGRLNVHCVIIIIIITIILIHYHKRLMCRRIESAYRFIGLAFSSRFLFLHSVSCVYIQLCKAIKKNSQPGAGERGGGTGVTCRLCVFMKRMCGGCRFEFVMEFSRRCHSTSHK